MHILGLPASVYRLSSCALRQDAQQREINLRHKLLRDWERLKCIQVPDPDIARITCIRRATFYRCKRAIARYGTQGLARRSTHPRRRGAVGPPPVNHEIQRRRAMEGLPLDPGSLCIRSHCRRPGQSVAVWNTRNISTVSSEIR